MHNSAAVLENDTHKLLWDFDLQMDHLISTRRPDHRIKLKEWEKKYKHIDLAWELKKTMEGDNYTNRDLCFWCSN